MIVYKLTGKTTVFLLVLFELTAFLGSVRASEIQTFEVLQKKIESLEKKLINNMEETAYAELLKLKSQINRE